MADELYPITKLPQPDPEYGPAEVIDIQLSALASNDDPVVDAGIKTAYNFASPANRRATGPLDRFIKMVNGPQYAPMIDHTEATTGPLERDGDRAQQRVTLTGPSGRTVTYLFGLSQYDGPEESLVDCWLTDSVLID
ncbi:DUF4864 domain-containing protein [Halovenus sp. HT40]|uniref:DUF4864 domain-containing protein n=1 Tax=Halovenus sp. HT40 TaxID=3126691 RepID=UPI00300E8B24